MHSEVDSVNEIFTSGVNVAHACFFVMKEHGKDL